LSMMAPPSQELEPPANPGRFTDSKRSLTIFRRASLQLGPESVAGTDNQEEAHVER
jgi:hypothetical protein